MPDDTKQRIDKMKQRVVFWTPIRAAAVPYLKLLLDAALQQRPLQILYDSRDGANRRSIQPIGVYSYNGFWYCPSYCFLKETYLLFRADRVLQAEWTDEKHPTIDLSEFPISHWFKPPCGEGHEAEQSPQKVEVIVRFTAVGVRRCRWESWFHNELQVDDEGKGMLKLRIRPDEMDYYASYFLSLGADAVVEPPAELNERIRQAVEMFVQAYGMSQGVVIGLGSD
ncbi:MULTISPECIES: WYL domain-containing protein [unclassified Paenibacillus]